MHPIKGTPVRCTPSRHPQALWDSGISDDSGTVTAVVAPVCPSFHVVLRITVLGWMQTPNQHSLGRGKKTCIFFFFSHLRDTGEMQALPSNNKLYVLPTGSPEYLSLIWCWPRKATEPFCDCRLWGVAGWILRNSEVQVISQ